MLDALRRLLPAGRDVADAVRSNRRFFDLVRDAAFSTGPRVPLDLEARIEALVAPFAAAPVASGLDGLLVHLALWGEQTTETTADVVTLSTYHSAKGLEFERVICTNVHTSAFPPYYAASEEERRESRRVLYVGMTRAMTHLVLAYPQRSRRNRALSPSPFLRGLPPEHTSVREVFRG